MSYCTKPKYGNAWYAKLIQILGSSERRRGRRNSDMETIVADNIFL